MPALPKISPESYRQTSLQGCISLPDARSSRAGENPVTVSEII